jgi:Na+-transporting NADH:ubiquinone oxidoreductase subunit C
MQLAYGAVAYNRAILEAAGIVASDPPASDREVVARFLDLDRRIVEVATGRFSDAVDAASYDFRAELERDAAGRPAYMPVYFVEPGPDAQAGSARVVLPFYGRGMWSTIQGVIALAGDFDTIVGIRIYAHGETPGIGDKIENPAWLASWRGKRIADAGGSAGGAAGIGVGGERAAVNRVDAITGATVSSTAVGRAVNDWFGPQGYAPLLDRLKGAAR